MFFFFHHINIRKFVKPVSLVVGRSQSIIEIKYVSLDEENILTMIKKPVFVPRFMKERITLLR